jgi:hypothetical protein
MSNTLNNRDKGSFMLYIDNFLEGGRGIWVRDGGMEKWSL